MDKAFFSELTPIIENSGSTDDVTYDNDTGEIKLIKNEIELDIYINDRLIGYKLYKTTAPEYYLLSDTDLHDLEAPSDIVDSMKAEINYVLKEYLAGNIDINAQEHNRWFSKKKKAYFVSLNLPKKGRVEYQLPCINIVDFGL